MTTCNHMLVGTIIAVTIREPLTAVPLAFLSHFLLDALPHFGNTNSRLNAHQKFTKYFTVEIISLLGIAYLLSLNLYGTNLVTLCVVAAIIPDTEWPIRYFLFQRKGKQAPPSLTAEFHKKIQWLEREWGLVVEILFFVIGFLILKSLI